MTPMRRRPRMAAETTKFVARVNARTRANEGDRIELAVDTASMHFFEPESGGRI